MKALVLLNDSAGRMSAEESQRLIKTISAALQAAGVEAEIRQLPHQQLEVEAKHARESTFDAVVAGGGDGTLSTVAGAIAGTSKSFGILPLGTLNHFAKDLNIPLDLEAACQVIGGGRRAAIDVGMLNERVFLNNSSLGVYPRTVLERESQQRRTRLSKWPAMFLAILKTFRRFPLLSVRVETETGPQRRKTPLVFVGNNCYQLEMLSIGKRECLHDGELSLYVANTQSRWGMLKLALRALFGRLRQAKDFEESSVKECWIETRRKRLHVAVDGEVIQLRPPLHYRICPGGLQVLVPEVQEQALPAGQTATTTATK